MNKPAPWTPEKFASWYAEHPVIASRTYNETIEPRITALSKRPGFKVESYGTLPSATRNPATGETDVATHNVYRILVGTDYLTKPTYLIMGGTHGYEKGGPLAALGFAEEEAAEYAKYCNLVIYPCLCPGPYEKELRFTEGRIDPNRDALPVGAKSLEMQAFAASLKEVHARAFGGDLTQKFAAAIDLHETPKKDLEIDEENAAVGGEQFELSVFPEGMFVIAFDKDRAYAEQIIRTVAAEGHPVVVDSTIYGSPNQGGYILMGAMGTVGGRVRQLTAIYTMANFTTEFCGLGITDEMPDAERAAPQRAAIRGFLPAPRHLIGG